MRVTYASQDKLVYISLREQQPGDSVHQCQVDCDEAKGMIVLDIDKTGRLIGIEVLGKGGVPMELLDEAERLGRGR